MSKTAEFFNGLNERAGNGEFASQAGNVFQFVIEGAGTWTLDLKDSNSVSNEAHDGKADGACDGDFLELLKSQKECGLQPKCNIV